MLIFEPFPKIGRVFRSMTVTEKLDGTNGQIMIINSDELTPKRKIVDDNFTPVSNYLIAAGSRNRFVSPDSDNYGFAKWVLANREELVEVLGEGTHYGEWWGQGIQRTYGLKEKRFSLFNTGRWTEDTKPSCCSVVPTLFQGLFDTDTIRKVVEDLVVTGSIAAPGFMNAEGVIVYHSGTNSYLKVTCNNDGVPKALAPKEIN